MTKTCVICLMRIASKPVCCARLGKGMFKGCKINENIFEVYG